MSLLLARIAAAHRGGSAAASYRYIRLYITANNGDGSYSGIGECIMALDQGGPTVCAGGSATASSQYPGPGAVPAAAFNGNYTDISDGWVTNTGQAIPSWLQYDFGAGVTRAIREIRLYNQANQYTRVPKDLVVQGSNDGATFTDIKTVTGLTGWVNSTPKVLSIP